jgi:protein TonB
LKPARWKDGLPALLFVGALHAAALTGVLLGLHAPVPDDFKPPTLSGVLVAEAPRQVAPPAITPPPPKPQPKPPPVVRRKPAPPPVKAPPTKRSITVPREEPQEIPEPEAPVAVSESPAPVASEQPATSSNTGSASNAAAAGPAGEAVVPPLAHARHLNNPAPPYPPGARRRGEEGTVRLSVLVRADGTVGDLSVERSSGYPELDRSARVTVARWRFTPASRGGKPIDFRHVQPITFTLRR